MIPALAGGDHSWSDLDFDELCSIVRIYITKQNVQQKTNKIMTQINVRMAKFSC